MSSRGRASRPRRRTKDESGVMGAALTQRMDRMSRNTIVVLVVVLIVIFGGYSLIG